jgi:polysaccharide export outer membrane protein
LVRQGFALAERRACYAARAEFIGALELVAQMLDAETASDYHSRCLAAGLGALREADDFLPRGSQLAAEMDLRGVVTGHRTPVLKEVSSSRVTAPMAQQRYYDYAQTQLAQAGADWPVASRALLGLGKVYMTWSGPAARHQLAHAPKAMVACQAALLVDRRNHLAANELGVLLARFGQLREARAALRHAVSVTPVAESWHNLAVVHDRLGEVDLARRARDELQAAARQAGREPSRTPVVWLTPEQFQRSTPSPAAAPEITPPARPTIKPASHPKSSSWWQTSFCEPALDSRPAGEQPTIRLCQWPGVPDGGANCGAGCGRMASCGLPPAFPTNRPGEYLMPERIVHVPEYRLRVDDGLEVVYRLTREQSSSPYRLNVGDVIMVESLTDPTMNRGDLQAGQGLVIQPDGTITLHMLGQVPAARLTVEELRQKLNELYKRFHRDPQIIVTPLKVNTKLEDLRAAVSTPYYGGGEGGQARRVQVMPDGTIQLPAIGSVVAQGLTLDELKREVDERYAEIVTGIEATPVLRQRAPRYVFVVGEVRKPGRYTLEGPTTVMQAIAMAESWIVGANLKEVVVFRRDECWQLLATKLDIRAALLGKQACPAYEIWLRDSDLVIVPQCSMRVANDWIELVFTRGLYGVLPANYTVNVLRGSML